MLKANGAAINIRTESSETYDIFCSEHDVMLSDDGLCRKCKQDYDRATPPAFTHLVPRPSVTFVDLRINENIAEGSNNA